MKFVPYGTSEICLRHMKYATRMKCASHMKERILSHILPTAKYFIIRRIISYCAAIFHLICYNVSAVIWMKENKLVDLSMDFSVKILKLCETVKGHYSLVNQLERSGTSIGANIHEANYAHSKADFVAKLQIALKECYETEYWLELFSKSELTDKSLFKPLFDQCGTIRRILIASINTAKQTDNQRSNFSPSVSF